MRPALVPPLLARALGLSLLVAGGAGCAHAPAAPGAARPAGPGPGRYFPLAVGNEWTWEDQSPQLPAERRGALRVVRIQERSADGFYRDNERGELKAGADCVRDRQRQLLCAPLVVGTSWKSVLSVSSTEKYEITAVGETVTTPAGSFRDCVRVRAVNHAAAGTDLVNEITYAPGVGPVRIETFAVMNGVIQQQLRAVLRAYRVEGT
jgi:hypothetical protein